MTMEHSTPFRTPHYGLAATGFDSVPQKSDGNVRSTYPAEMQMAVAILTRVGFGRFILQPDGYYYETGPLSPADNNEVGATLYTQVDAVATWADGQKYHRSITFDPNYADMSITDTYSWQSGSTQTNITAEDANYLLDDAPPGNLTTAYISTFNGASGSVKTESATDTVLTINWSGCTDSETGKYLIGVTIVVTLSKPKTWADFSDICAGMLSQITLQTTTSAYLENDFGHGVPFNWTLCYPSQSVDYTSNNAVCVALRRGLGFVFGFSIFGSTPAGSPRPWFAPGPYFNINLQPLAANGFPLLISNYNSTSIANFNMQPQVVCIKSAVRPVGQIALSASSVFYDASTNTFGAGIPTGIATNNEEQTFDPTNVNGIGYLTAAY